MLLATHLFWILIVQVVGGIPLRYLKLAVYTIGGVRLYAWPHEVPFVSDRRPRGTKMDVVVLSHGSALECLRAVARSGRQLRRVAHMEDARCVADMRCLSTTRSASWIAGSVSDPPHLLVSGRSSSYETKRYRAHALSNPIAGEWLCRIDRSVFFAGPELASIEIAGALPRSACGLTCVEKNHKAREGTTSGPTRPSTPAVGRSRGLPAWPGANRSRPKDPVCDGYDLLMLLYELCGGYAFAVDGSLLQRRSPLTTCDDLARACAWFTGHPGVARNKRLLPFVREGARSPMEVRLVLLLCLPMRFGGYGLPWPELNASVSVGDGREVGGAVAATPDLLWRDASFALEYDSVAYHASDRARDGDSIRRNTLGQAGVAVESVRASQILDGRHMDNVARAVARHLGVQMRHQFDSAVLVRRALLRRRLLAGLGPGADGALS